MTRPRVNYSPNDLNVSFALLVSSSGLAGVYSDFNFRDGSINYFGFNIKQDFHYTLIDNIGNGEIRVTYNRPEYNISSSVIGAKTLKAGDSLYIEEEVWHIRIYYISPSVVELVLKSDKSGGYGL